MGVKMDADGKKLTEPIEMDTTKLGILADNKIYSTIYSQDKQKIMVYKMQHKNQQVTIVTKLAVYLYAGCCCLIAVVTDSINGNSFSKSM